LAGPENGRDGEVVVILFAELRLSDCRSSRCRYLGALDSVLAKWLLVSASDLLNEMWR
jgi:hypothetical protein